MSGMQICNSFTALYQLTQLEVFLGKNLFSVLAVCVCVCVCVGGLHAKCFFLQIQKPCFQ